MNDILLTRNGDLHINERGDIELTTSVGQSVRVHLLWFFNEWRFAPQFGLPWFEDVFVKNPDIQRIRRIIRDEAEKVEAVAEARNVNVNVDIHTRKAKITLEIVTTGESFTEEVLINV